MKSYFKTELGKLYCGDVVDVLKKLESNSIDAVVTDPPYGLGFMGKEWDTMDKSQFGQKGKEGKNDLKVKKNFKILPRYKANGSSEALQEFCYKWAKECLRVLKPGGHLLSFGGTRTYHRMACAIEDAGFEIRDMLEWIYNTGFPKSYNVAKGMNKYLKTGNASWNGTGDSSNGALGYSKIQYKQGYRPNDYSNKHKNKDKITEKEAMQWEGFGTALKPAHEPIVLARKPLSEKTIVENCIKYGTGALDIEGCRIPLRSGEDLSVDREGNKKLDTNKQGWGFKAMSRENEDRFPANLLVTDNALGKEKSRYFDIDVWGEKNGLINTPKASKKEKGKGNTHPTVKPIHLISWFVRLISKKNDIILDQFLGSGTTAIVAEKLGRKWIGVEKSKEYCEMSKKRILKESNQRKLFRR